jgi:hypothetical protein
MPWKNGIFYPDTILPELNPNPYEFNNEYHFSFGEGNFNENTLFDMFSVDTLSIFFFEPDTIAKYNWATVREDYKILVRYDLSYSDLKQLDWCIYYPPTEEMKDMKIFP